MKKLIFIVTIAMMVFVCRTAFSSDKQAGFSYSEARKAISVDIAGFSYDNRLGIIRLTPGYFIPATAGGYEYDPCYVRDLNVVTEGKMLVKRGGKPADANAADVNALIGNAHLNKSEAAATYQPILTTSADVNVGSVEANNITVKGGGSLIGVTAANLRILLGEAKGSTGAFTGDITISHGLSADPNVIVQTPDIGIKIKMVFHDATNITFRALDHNDVNAATTNASWSAWK
jgi:hypothetical protein